MKWFCPFCWKEVKDSDEVCPFCKKDLSKFHDLEFEEKLILSLKNPVSQNRLFAIQTLGRLKSKKAASRLCEMLKSNPDTYEAMELIRALKNINTPFSTDCIKEFLQATSNKILKRFVQELLDAET